MILPIYYTHNRIRDSLLSASISSVMDAASAGGAHPPVVCSWEKIAGANCEQILCEFHHNGLLNILIQILRVIYTRKISVDAVSFCEHDCLYPANYFLRVQAALDSAPNKVGVWDMNYLGLNGSGYCRVNQRDQPMSTLTLRMPEAVLLLEDKVRKMIKGEGCCIEPDDKTTVFRLEASDEIPPVIHVNMNGTKNNHHLTSHYNVYAKEAYSQTHPYWGDYMEIGIFSPEEVPSLRPTWRGYTFRSALYGAGEKRDPAMSLVRRGIKNEVFTLSNEAAGFDPFPGVRKDLIIRMTRDADGSDHCIRIIEGDIFDLLGEICRLPA